MLTRQNTSIRYTNENQYGATFPITAKFFLSGKCRVKTDNAPEIAADYEEVAGYNYLYHLPDLIESEEYPSGTPLQMVVIYADAKNPEAFSTAFRRKFAVSPNTNIGA